MQETQTFKNLRGKSQDNYPEMIVVHHSAATENQTIKSIEDYHLSLGWEGVGYQYLITKYGEVYQGRPEYYHGAHTTGHNNDSIGICLVGNFDISLPTEAQKNALVSLIGDIQERYNIGIDKIYPHRKFANKTCFGKLLPDDWAGDLVAKASQSSKNKIKVEIKGLVDLL